MKERLEAIQDQCRAETDSKEHPELITLYAMVESLATLLKEKHYGRAVTTTVALSHDSEEAAKADAWKAE